MRRPKPPICLERQVSYVSFCSLRFIRLEVPCLAISRIAVSAIACSISTNSYGGKNFRRICRHEGGKGHDRRHRYPATAKTARQAQPTRKSSPPIGVTAPNI